MIKLKKTPSKKLTVLFLIVLLILAGFGFFKIIQKRLQRSQQKQQVVEVERGDIQRTLSLSGRIDAHQRVTLKFQTSGLLSWVGVKEGDWVRRGQAIASLDRRELKKTLEKKMNDYLKARWDWEQAREDYSYKERWFELSDEVKRILEKNQFDLNKAVLDVELADLALRLSTITTPIEGIVTKVDTPFAGVNITPATAKFEVVNPKTVYFSAEVDEEDIGKLKEGMGAKITLDAYQNKVFEGKITKIHFSPVSTSGSPSYQVEIDFLNVDNNDLKFRLGMEGEAEVVVASAKNVLTLPTEAIKGEEQKWVWLIDKKGKKRKVRVELGLESEDKVEVKSGLREGERVLVDLGR